MAGILRPTQQLSRQARGALDLRWVSRSPLPSGHKAHSASETGGNSPTAPGPEGMRRVKAKKPCPWISKEQKLHHRLAQRGLLATDDQPDPSLNKWAWAHVSRINMRWMAGVKISHFLWVTQFSKIFSRLIPIRLLVNWLLSA